MSIGILTRVSGLVSEGPGNIPKAAAQSDVGKGTFQKDFAKNIFFDFFRKSKKSAKAPGCRVRRAPPFIRYGVVGNISACHADAQGSIPCFGVYNTCAGSTVIVYVPATDETRV